MAKLPTQDLSAMRLDKWLWAARFFKTRHMAVEAITGGKVHLNGQRIKPAKDIKPGDQLLIHKEALEWDVEIVNLSAQRRPAAEAMLLYLESNTSKTRREEVLAAQRLSREAGVILGGTRPTKRDRRQIHRFTADAG